MDKTAVILHQLAGWINLQPRVRIEFAEWDIAERINTSRLPLLELLLVYSGRIRLTVGHVAHQLTAGQIALVNAHLGNRGVMEESGTRYGCISFSVEGAAAFTWLARTPLLCMRQLTDIGSLRACYRGVYQRMHGQDVCDTGHFQLKAAALELLATAITACHAKGISSRKPHGEYIDRTLSFLHEHYADPRLDLSALANAVHLSTDHFGRLFRKQVGMSPMQYLMRLRLTAARRLLMKTDLPIKQIAATVGLHDQLYFSRLFHRMQGVSPQAYRRQLEDSQ